jgi:hypothetical protein
MGFRQQDLLEDELKVVLDEFHGWRLIAGGMATRRLKGRLIGVDQLGRFFRWLLEKSEPSYMSCGKRSSPSTLRVQNGL